MALTDSERIRYLLIPTVDVDIKVRKLEIMTREEIDIKLKEIEDEIKQLNDEWQRMLAFCNPI